MSSLMRESGRRKEGGRGKKKEEGGRERGSREERRGGGGRGRRKRHRRQWTTRGKRNRDLLFSREVSPSWGLLPERFKVTIVHTDGDEIFPCGIENIHSCFFLSIPTTTSLVSNRVSQPQHCWHLCWIILRWKGWAWALYSLAASLASSH